MVRDGTQTTWSFFLAILDSPFPIVVLRGFSTTPPSPAKKYKKNVAFLKKSIYQQAVYVTKEHWLQLLFAIFYESNTVQC